MNNACEPYTHHNMTNLTWTLKDHTHFHFEVVHFYRAFIFIIQYRSQVHTY